MRELKIYRVHGYGDIIKHFQKNTKKGLTNKNKDCIVFLSNQYENRENKKTLKISDKKVTRHETNPMFRRFQYIRFNPGNC